MSTGALGNPAASQVSYSRKDPWSQADLFQLKIRGFPMALLKTFLLKETGNDTFFAGQISVCCTSSLMSFLIFPNPGNIVLAYVIM